MFCISNAAVQHVKKISVVQYSTILGKGFPTGSCEDKYGATDAGEVLEYSAYCGVPTALTGKYIAS